MSRPPLVGPDGKPLLSPNDPTSPNDILKDCEVLLKLMYSRPIAQEVFIAANELAGEIDWFIRQQNPNTRVAYLAMFALLGSAGKRIRKDQENPNGSRWISR